MITCAHCGHEFSSALAACPVCHIPVNGIPQWLFRGKSAPSAGERGAQPPITAIDIAGATPGAGLPATGVTGVPAAVPSHPATQPELETPALPPTAEPAGTAADSWTPLSTALGLGQPSGPEPGRPAPGPTGSAAGAATAPEPSPAPSHPAEPEAAFAPLTTPPSSSLPSPTVRPAPGHLESITPVPQPTGLGESPVGSHAEVAHLFAAGPNHAEPNPLQPPDETTPHVRPLDRLGPADVAVEVESSSFDVEPPAFAVDGAQTPASPVAEAPPAAPAPANAIDTGETTLRLSEILPDSQRRGSALFGIGDDSTAQLSKELLNSASLLRAPLDQPVNASPPVWQQPMGAPLTTGISASVSPGLGSSFPPGPPDSLFEGRPVPSAADMAAAAAASQGFSAPGAPRPVSDPFNPAVAPPAPTQTAGQGGFDQSPFGATVADDSPTVPPYYPDYPHYPEPGAPLAGTPADASAATGWNQPVIGEGGPPGGSDSTPPADSPEQAGRRPPQGQEPHRRPRASLIVGGAAIVVGVVLVALLVWYLLSQWTPTPEQPAGPTPTTTATDTLAPSQTPAETPSPTPPPSQPAPPQRAAGALPADTIKVCEDNAVGVQGLALSCDVAKTVATTIPANATGDFTINAYISVLNRNGDFACSTLDTYYQCTLTSTGAVYRIAFGREGR